MLIVVIIGIVLLMLNVCACGAVIYQKHRVRQREDNLRRRIKRLSDAGMIRNDQSNNEAGAASTASGMPRYCVGASGNDNDNGGRICNNDSVDESCDEDEAGSEAADSIEAAGQHDHHHNHHLAHLRTSDTYLIAHGDPLGPHHHQQPQPLSNALALAGSGLHNGHGLAYPVKSALRQHPRMIDVNQDKDYLVAQRVSACNNNHDSNTSSLARDMRYSRSMGNNLDSVHMNASGAASRSIAALDILPRSTLADNSTVIFNQTPQCVGMTSAMPGGQQPRRPVLPRDASQVPSSALCLHSLRNRWAGNDSTTTGSSASGSRPPSPIIEVIPVSEYETMYGSLQHHHQHSPIYSPQYAPASLQHQPQQPRQPLQHQPVYNSSSSSGGGCAPPGVVYPVYNTSRMSSTLPMSSSSAAAASVGMTTGLRHFDYAPRGNFTAKPLRLPPPTSAQPAGNGGGYWGTLQHMPPSSMPALAAVASQPSSSSSQSSGMLLQQPSQRLQLQQKQPPNLQLPYASRQPAAAGAPLPMSLSTTSAAMPTAQGQS